MTPWLCLLSAVVQMVERETVLLKKIEINVAESEKRSGKNTVNMHETYTVYLIEIRWVLLRSVSLGGGSGSGGGAG